MIYESHGKLKSLLIHKYNLNDDTIGYFNNYLHIGKPLEMLVGPFSDQYSFLIPF